MLVFNIRLSAKKLLCAFGIISVAAAIICIICMISIHGSIPDSATCDELGAYSLAAKTDSEQIEFLSNFGLTANAKSKKSEYVTIPSSFNKVYQSYNALQRKIGLDLERYKGKNALKITYKIDNLNNKFAVLLVFKDRVIGAHITNGEYGSENLPLVNYGQTR